MPMLVRWDTECYRRMSPTMPLTLRPATVDCTLVLEAYSVVLITPRYVSVLSLTYFSDTRTSRTSEEVIDEELPLRPYPAGSRVGMLHGTISVFLSLFAESTET